MTHFEEYTQLLNASFDKMTPVEQSEWAAAIVLNGDFIRGEAIELGVDKLSEDPELSSCPYCGTFGPDYGESDAPADYCHHVRYDGNVYNGVTKVSSEMRRAIATIVEAALKQNVKVLKLAVDLRDKSAATLT